MVNIKEIIVIFFAGTFLKVITKDY